PGLPRAEELAGAAQPQVHFRDGEAVIRFHQRADSLAGGVVQPLRDQDAIALLAAAADSPAELMQLRQTVALGLLDQHHGRVGNVYADLDYSGRNQNLDLPLLKAF